MDYPVSTAMALQACAARPDFDVGAVDSNSELMLVQQGLLLKLLPSIFVGYFIKAVRKVANANTY